MKNVHSLLRTGGETLLVFLGTCPIFEVYEIQSRKPEWQPYMKVSFSIYCIRAVNNNHKFTKNHMKTTERLLMLTSAVT